MKERKGWKKKTTDEECKIDDSLLILKKGGRKGVDKKTVDEGQM